MAVCPYLGGTDSLSIADLGRLLNAPYIAHAGRLLNALRQHTAHELKTSMDSLKLITAWDTRMLQVSRVSCTKRESIAVVYGQAVHMLRTASCNRTSAFTPHSCQKGQPFSCSNFLRAHQSHGCMHVTDCKIAASSVTTCSAGSSLSFTVKCDTPRRQL